MPKTKRSWGLLSDDARKASIDKLIDYLDERWESIKLDTSALLKRRPS